MKKVIRVFLWIGMISGIWWVFPFIQGKKVMAMMDNGQPVPTNQKVLTLIFVNVISGILLLCDNNA